jgi:phosphatidylglycerol---prolipoprotein diacylglyceryl transferase
MHPILFSFSLFGKPIIIASYGVLLTVSMFVSFFLTIILSRKSKFSRDDTASYLLILIASGMGGAYLIGLITSLPDLIRNGLSSFQPILVSWGGILGGILAACVMAKGWKFSLAAFADLCTPGYLIGIGIGRIGCFFGGCCFGVHTDSFCGVRFTDPIALASQSVQPLIPTQLISAGVLITGACIFAVYYNKKPSASGRLFAVSALFYSVFRFTIEFWRDDPRLFLFHLSDGQLFSLLFFITGIVILIKTSFKNSHRL